MSMTVGEMKKLLSQLDDAVIIGVCIADARERASDYYAISGWIGQHVEKKMIEGKTIIEPTYDREYSSNMLVLYPRVGGM